MSIIGIDLGTTFSLVAHYNPATGHVTVIEDGSTGYVVPSAVYYPESGQPIVGSEAINAGEYAGNRLVRFIKMNMGTDFRVKIGDREYTPAEVSSEILRKLKQNAETYLNIGPDDFESIVITVPAYFGDAPRAATLEAARLAGFDMNKVRLFAEPCAAALAWVAEAGANLGAGVRRVLVSDLGGGTYDATIIETKPFVAPGGRTHLQIDVVCKKGSQELGGVQWDNALVEHVKAQCASTAGHAGLTSEDPGLAHALLERVIKGKENLSKLTPVRIGCCTGKYLEISRETFEEKTFQYFAEMDVKLREVMAEDRVLQEELVKQKKQTQVVALGTALLAGGASKMPRAQAIVREVTGLEPLIHRSLEQIVAIGAAYEAAITSGVMVESGPTGLILETPRDILGGDDVGLLVFDPPQGKDQNAVVLKKGVLEGVEKSREDFVTSADNQPAIRFRILEGMSKEPEECVVLGDATLALPPGQPRGMKVKVVLTVGPSGTVIGKGICFTTDGPREVPISVKRKAL